MNIGTELSIKSIPLITKCHRSTCRTPIAGTPVISDRQTTPTVLYRQDAVKKANFYPGSGFVDTILKVANEGGIFIEHYIAICDVIKNNPEFRKFPGFHFSKEGLNPYYSAWGLQKVSPWQEIVNKHLLQCHQVST